MSKHALIIIDVQNAIINEGPFKQDLMISGIQTLTAAAKQKGIEVIYVRHTESEGEFVAGTETWEIFDAIKPSADEKIINKYYNSAFHKTDLHAYLVDQDVRSVILVGMQTEYCIDATVRSAFDLDYEVIVPEDLNTSFDNAYMTAENLVSYYQKRIWHGRFASVLPLDVVIKRFS